jgi:hypothetical protein
VEGTDPGDFTRSNDDCSGTSLDPGETCTVDLAFAPTGSGAREATVVASASPGGTASAAVSGMGQTPANLTLTPASLDFGSVLRGTVSTKILTVTNTGQQAATIVSFNFSGSTRFADVGTTCGTELAGGASCTLSMRFSPGASDSGEMTGQATVVGPVGGSPSATLTGTAVSQPAVLHSAGDNIHTINDSLVADGARSNLLQISNVGEADTGPLTFQVLVSSGNVEPRDFNFNPNVPGVPNCGGQGIVLREGEYCAVAWGFKALAGGADAWDVTVTVSGTPGGTVNRTYVNTSAG